MRRMMILVTLIMVGFTLFATPFISNPPLEREEKKLSPYFFVQGDPEVDHFPLLSTKAKVKIAGVIAEVELTQIYKNEGKRTIEAIYVFPLGTRSAIHAMRMRIGNRTIEAKIEEREVAQKIYQSAKDQGKTASLLEQKRPNVFQMKVANIMPGDVVEVVVEYTEILVPEEGIYEFVFPTVVGPRYTGEKDENTLEKEDNWVATPYLHEGEEPPYIFHIEVNLNTPVPVKRIWVPSHKVVIKEEGKGIKILLSQDEVKGGNRDFILRYTLKGKAIKTGALLYPGKEENFFLLMVQPPERITPASIPPREYIFIVDVSGSMYGFPLEVSKALIKKIIENLRKGDYFNILFFSGGSKALSPYPLPATPENKKKAIAMLLSQRGGGGTRILQALKKALSLPKKEGLSRIVVIATDGYVCVEKETFDLIRKNLHQANFFAFGIGKSVNRYLIEGIARVGQGCPFVVTDQKEAKVMAERFIKYVSSPLLTDIKVEFEGFDAYDIQPSSFPDLFSERPLVIFGKYTQPQGRIVVKGNTPGGEYRREILITQEMEDKNNTALKYLWAREKIAQLSDYANLGADVKEEVKKLGLKYHLMTAYTSFVAVDTVVRETGEVVTVKQPLPLPQGVSNYAVGEGLTGIGFVKAGGVKMFTAREEIKSYPQNVTWKPTPQPTLFFTNAVCPKDLRLEDVEKLVRKSIGKELERIFKNWELKSLTILLKVEGGGVKKVEVKRWEGKNCDFELMKRLWKKVNFPPHVNGTVLIELKYI
ncbi:VWA domain-containing protein [Candidatus Calescamantes bacterium]|nr:VWA domain-containing protein [Candidatus Calescamantes bacterium]